MKNFVGDAEIPFVLSTYKGAYAQIWKFNVSHKKLAIRLSFSFEEDNLYLLATSCEFISGPFAWDDCDLEYKSNLVSSDNGDFLSELTDTEAGFKLIVSGGISFILVTESNSTFLEDF